MSFVLMTEYEYEEIVSLWVAIDKNSYFKRGWGGKRKSYQDQLLNVASYKIYYILLLSITMKYQFYVIRYNNKVSLQ